jgi:hypothetical protein
MKVKNIILSTLFVAFSCALSAQNNSSKWTFGISAAAAMYGNSDGKIAGSGAYVDQPIRFNVSRYVYKGMTLDAAFATSLFDAKSYTTFDGALRYDFRTSYDTAVPYVLIGGSFISAVKLTPTLNFGVGNTFWFSPSYGLNVQLLYKFSESKFESQRSHLYPSFGLVYSFGERSMNPRLWEMSH